MDTNLNDYINDVDSLNVENQTSLKDVTGKQREELKKEEEMDLKENILWLKDMSLSLFGLMMRPDGKPVDFSDKEGREKQTNTLAVIKEQIAGLISQADLNNQDYATQISGAIPKKIEAEFSAEDRKRIDGLQRYWKCVVTFFATSIASFIIGGCVLCYYVGDFNKRSATLKSWYVDNKNAIDFGTYLKDNEPKIYEYWQSGRWQRDKALRDSVNKARKMRE